MSIVSPIDDSSNIRALVERQKKAWESGNIELLLNDFTEDCLFIVPGQVIQGKSQLRQVAIEYWQHYSGTQIEIYRVFFQESEGAIEWQWRDKEKETGKQQLAYDAIIFDLQNYKIKYWREYIDKQ